MRLQILSIDRIPLRHSYETLSMTARILNTSIVTVKRYLNNTNGYYSKVFGRQVIIQSIGGTLHNNPIVHRLKDNSPMIQLIKGSLNSLSPYIL